MEEMQEACPFLHAPDPHTVQLTWNRPAVVLWDGSLALFVDDFTTDLPTFSGISKKMVIARLRAIADMIENAD